MYLVGIIEAREKARRAYARAVDDMVRTGAAFQAADHRLEAERRATPEAEWMAAEYEWLAMFEAESEVANAFEWPPAQVSAERDLAEATPDGSA